MIQFFRSKSAIKPPHVFILSFIGLSMPIIGLYASKGIIILFGLATLSSLFLFIFNKESRCPPPKTLTLPVIALTFWGTASLIWTVSSDLSWNIAKVLPITMLSGLLIIMLLNNINSDDRITICKSTLVGFFLGACIAFVDVISGYSIAQVLNIAKHGGSWSHYMHGFVINNGISLLIMLFWPTTIFLWSQKYYKLIFLSIIITSLITIQSSNFASVVAIGVGLFSFIFAFFIPRFTYKFAAVGLTILILGTPFFMKSLPDAQTIGKNLPELSYSIYPRLVIWQFASNLAMEKPITGHGIRTSRVLSKNPNQVPFLYRDNGKLLTGNTKEIPLHPHNGLIQIWLELGAVGALLVLTIVLCTLQNIKRSKAPKIFKSLAFAAFMSTLCLISVSYGLWQSWWMGALWLQAALIVLTIDIPEQIKNINIKLH